MCQRVRGTRPLVASRPEQCGVTVAGFSACAMLLRLRGVIVVLISVSDPKGAW